jgi:hypothetical protein
MELRGRWIQAVRRNIRGKIEARVWDLGLELSTHGAQYTYFFRRLDKSEFLLEIALAVLLQGRFPCASTPKYKFVSS